MQETGTVIDVDGMVGRRFEVAAGPSSVPGVLWQPDVARPGAALVLLGHGGTQHKAHPRVLERVGLLVREHGFSVATIDGPVHGERRPAEVEDPDDSDAMWQPYRAYVRSLGAAAFAAQLVGEWRATLDTLSGWPELRDRPVASWGLSMSSRSGVALVADEARITVAVLGLVGTTAGDYIARAAARITTPVLFVANEDDELFPFDGALELYRAIGAADKRLHVFPGAHGALPVDEYATMARFIELHTAG